MSGKKESTKENNEKNEKNNTGYPVQDIDALQKESEEKTTKKPGSQTHHTERHNNGRGGGK